MTYTANGRLQTVKDANNNVTSYQYDSQDRLATRIYPDSSTKKFAYDSQGDATTVVEPYITVAATCSPMFCVTAAV